MVKKSKILQKILSGSKNVRFSEFTVLIEGFGFTLERISGSHHVFSHLVLKQPVSVQPDQNGQAKPYQLKQFIKLIEKHDLKLSDAED
ncbi:MAG: type II toxin-antitoxin system HicA family toxin [Burkholderiales bacterium]|nr:type II toxin-antitoxin system HicA family toxin [Anaerolineae bacterium]